MYIQHRVHLFLIEEKNEMLMLSDLKNKLNELNALFKNYTGLTTVEVYREEYGPLMHALTIIITDTSSNDSFLDEDGIDFVDLREKLEALLQCQIVIMRKSYLIEQTLESVLIYNQAHNVDPIQAGKNLDHLFNTHNNNLDQTVDWRFEGPVCIPNAFGNPPLEEDLVVSGVRIIPEGHFTSIFSPSESPNLPSPENAYQTIKENLRKITEMQRKQIFHQVPFFTPQDEADPLTLSGQCNLLQQSLEGQSDQQQLDAYTTIQKAIESSNF